MSPPRSELGELRQPLEDGEWRVLEFFERYLPEGWEIYIQPHLNGLRPDFVLLHPEVGIGVFEVKNWNLDTLDRWVEEREGKRPILKGGKDGKVFSLQSDNPVDKVVRYRDEIRDLYCPRLPGWRSLAIITAGTIFPSADDEQVAELLGPSLTYHRMDRYPRYFPVAGRRALEGGDIARVFPEARRTSSQYMTPELAKDLRLWLIEPDAPKTQRKRLELDAAQKQLADTRTESGFRRIMGPAGSGKSLVLAARAAGLASQDKDVLVVTFNITLLNYLADLSVRVHPAARKKITWLNFHHWCKRVCEDTDNAEEYGRLFGEGAFPDAELCDLVWGVLDSDSGGLVSHYDAIIVDEGQDFQPEWWALLRRVCRPGGEMLLAVDATQDVYDTARSWTDDAMTGAGFTGPWSRLGTSYRLPPKLTWLVEAFGQLFLPEESADLPPTIQLELDLAPCRLRWVQVAHDGIAATAVREMWLLLQTDENDGLSVSDATVLVDSEVLGERIVDLLAENGTRCISTFAENWKEGRRKKLGFFLGDARIKVTTLQSFKGGEARALIVCVQRAIGQRGKALLYAGLTRLKQHPLGSSMTVVCSEPDLAEYGSSWPEYIDEQQPDTAARAIG